jgi:hypothetical protein
MRGVFNTKFGMAEPPGRQNRTARWPGATRGRDRTLTGHDMLDDMKGETAILPDREGGVPRAGFVPDIGPVGHRTSWVKEYVAPLPGTAANPPKLAPCGKSFGDRKC